MMQLTNNRYRGGISGREFRGPAPGNVAIIAKNPKKGAVDNIILDARRKQEELDTATKLAKEQAFIDLKNTWDRETERKLMASSVKRKVKSMMAANQTEVEFRRNKLREILRQEEEQYLREMEDKQETMLERQAKMRDRAKFLKEKREKERMEFVEEKLDQRWRSQCEELRSTMSKRTQDEVSAELVFQMREKLDAQKEKEKEEKMYADMWEADMMAKADREDREAREKHARNKEQLAVLHTQMAALEERKAEEKRLIEEEAELLRQQAELRRLEEEREAEDRRRRQAESKQLYETNLRLKMKKKAREEQEQLAFDMKVLETLLQESANEAAELAQRKKELREENLRYMAYLKQLQEEEKAREGEMEAIINSEVEKNWQKRLAQWRLEREARKKMLQEVMAERGHQINERLRANAQRQMEEKAERERILEIIAENKRLEDEKKAQIKHKSLRYQQDLLDQMGYEGRMRSAQSTEDAREYIVGQQAEAEYQEKLKQCLSEPHSADHMHPMRRHYYRNQQINA
ncbi:cilia- and flagella-associated protein 53-like [Watersipora subatra]|uniref:cilia- and flagella-associated protein 53-like n=1 Tax=Watersipora subatra TaxID=2589382 RepID=UPI00355C644F